jgi:hypothetical protein
MKPSLRVRRFGTLALVPLVVLAGCSSTHATHAATCPSSGSVQSQTQVGSPKPTQITSYVVQTQGCIDHLQVNFLPTVPTVHASYENARSAVLRVEFDSTTLSASLPPVSSGPNSYHALYVKNVQVSTSRSGVTLTITLDRQRPFLVRSSHTTPLTEMFLG